MIYNHSKNKGPRFKVDHDTHNYGDYLMIEPKLRVTNTNNKVVLQIPKHVVTEVRIMGKPITLKEHEYMFAINELYPDMPRYLKGGVKVRPHSTTNRLHVKTTVLLGVTINGVHYDKVIGNYKLIREGDSWKEAR